MIDIEATIRAHLVTLAGIQAVFGSRVYMARALPPGYRPSDGPALLGMPRGGAQEFHSKLYRVSIQFRVYAETEAKARDAFQKLYAALNDTAARNIPYVRLEEGTMYMLLNEPETDWPYILSFFTFQLHDV